MFVSGFKYYVLFTDDFIGTLGSFDAAKIWGFSHFSKFVAYAETQVSLPLKQFQSDGGKEFDNLTTNSFVILKEFYIGILAHVQPNKMALQNANIVKSLIWVIPYS